MGDNLAFKDFELDRNSVWYIRGLSEAPNAKPFSVVDIFPGNKTQDVELEPPIQIHVSEQFDLATVTDKAVKLVRKRKMASQSQ